LQSSAGKVGSGNLEHRTGLDAKRDEVGDLARAFDDMVADLRRSYVMLENEIVQHRITRADLDRHKEGLEHLVEVRTSELESALAELEAATAAKDSFFAAMSHELRTPLNSIIGFSDIMLKGRAGSINEEQTRQLAMVNRSGKQLLAIISDLLDLARIEAGHITVVPGDVDVRELSHRVVAMMEPLAGEKGLKVTCSVEPRVPRSIYSDSGKVEQILLNLLSNAVKFTDVGFVRLDITRDEDGAGRVFFTVTDTGAGIPEDDLGRIFERFHQVATVHIAKPTGTGLGLAICRDLAHALGGSIEVESEPGVGSAFRLVLPEQNRL
ncbi:MAG: ATP-binding protein, partial [Actinomycetota bacterium]|nr:ATP-binding protein [Actinomycetota bacterium]